ncbi:MAG: thiamine phosphate synthase [Lachnospiraceae bacterium]|nr:thiamine phosphate synthase [Lachnospiraceae bacterium]
MIWKQNSLYLIADFSYGLQKLEQALACGIEILQLREKNISSVEYLERARILRRLTRQYDTVFIVNDRLDIAMLSEADGVHLGQSDVPARDARRLLGPDKIIGVTAKTAEQAVRAREDGADYLGSGAWYATSTKADAAPITEETYREILRESGLPNVAIGGITPENCGRPLACGADGIAAAAGILKGDVEANIRGFREKFQKR